MVSVNRYLGEFRSNPITVNIDIPEVFHRDFQNQNEFTIDIDNFSDDMTLISDAANLFVADTGFKTKVVWSVGFLKEE